MGEKIHHNGNFFVCSNNEFYMCRIVGGNGTESVFNIV